MQKTAQLDPVAFTQALIRSPSITPVDAGAIDQVAKAARDAGFETDVFESVSGDTPVRNLIAHRGHKGPRLAFVGHTDVVPPGNEAAWTHPPFSATLVDGKLYGRGAADMKGAIAAFTAASHQVDPSWALQLLITGDEEQGSPAGMRAIISRLEASHALPSTALIGEGSNEGSFGQGIRVGRRGSLNVTVTAHGVQGHVAWPQRARNAVHPLIHYLDTLLQQDLGPAQGIFPATSLQVTNVTVPNQAGNVVPGEASARFNIRFNPQHSGRALIERLQALAKPHGQDLTLSCNISGEPYVCEKSPLTQAVADAVQTVENKTASLNAGGGVSDGRFLHKYCPCVEFGLVGDSAHQVDEFTLAEDIHRLQRVYVQTLKNYFRKTA